MNQRQTGGDNSTNYQVAGDLHAGLSYRDVKEIADDVFHQNYTRLATEAASTAEERAREVCDKFLKKLTEESPESLENARNPDFQRALFRVQEEVATTGDENLSDLLVDILVDRSKQSGGSFRQVVLNEALKTAPRLTSTQVSVLGAIFMARYVNVSVNGIPQLYETLREFWLPLIKGLPQPSDANMGHIAYAGCGSISMGEVTFTQLFLKRYPGLLTLGFEEESHPWISEFKKKGIVMPCLRDPTKMQVAAVSLTDLENKLSTQDVGEHANELRGLLESNPISGEAIHAEIEAIDPEFTRFSEAWRNSAMKNFDLTSVGIAIAHAHCRKVLGSAMPSVDLWLS
ncbi:MULTISPECIES: LPO_1073/Vpar_1526 family protein [unclassified Streptomyces]|uniref:LPO_1073/Vpar_1526 family protein n=1 Tax=unclassified Streptomyces TaxID=2593676 RepID=UPI00131CFEAB|nr:LPO_1073/Vpar_1526 family protein [Streptomyces sp. CB01635]